MTEDPQALFRQLYTEQQMVSQNIDLQAQGLERLRILLNDYRVGFLVLEELEGRKEGEEMLLRVGGTIQIRATLADPGNVTRDVGSNVKIEQSVEDAKKEIQGTIEELEKNLQEASENYEKLVFYSQSINAKLQELAAGMQGQPKGE
jgi:prefoldin alpha subunit